ADELEGHQSAGAGDVVVADRVRVAFDRGEHETVDAAEAGELRGDRLGLGDVERDVGGLGSESLGDLSAVLVVTARDDDLVAAGDDVFGEFEPDTRGAADDEDGAG